VNLCNKLVAYRSWVECGPVPSPQVSMTSTAHAYVHTTHTHKHTHTQPVAHVRSGPEGAPSHDPVLFGLRLDLERHATSETAASARLKLSIPANGCAQTPRYLCRPCSQHGQKMPVNLSMRSSCAGRNIADRSPHLRVLAATHSPLSQTRQASRPGRPHGSGSQTQAEMSIDARVEESIETVPSSPLRRNL